MSLIITTSPKTPPEPGTFYCATCQCWYTFTELNSRPLDEHNTEKLCPECDSTLATLALDMID